MTSSVSSDPAFAYGTIDLSSSDLISHMQDELLPSKFYGISTSEFGNTRKNPFFKLRDIALNLSLPIEDRMRAVRFMDKIPHKDGLENTVKAAISIISDETVPIGERYFFMSNHETLSKLSDHVVKECHYYFFLHSEGKLNYPLILRLLSAQYIYSTENQLSSIWHSAQNFIVSLALDENETVRLRAEAADILTRQITIEDRQIGLDVIEKLGDLYLKNKMTSIYTNAQNAHNESITESVMSIIRTLLTERSLKKDKEADTEPETFTDDALSFVKEGNRNNSDIFEHLLKLKLSNDDKNKIFAAFNFVLIHPAKYEGITLSDIMCLVWNKIQSQELELRKELEMRFAQEMIDMDSSCGSGIASRFVNVLSGYVQEEGLQVRMSIKDQLRANVFARLHANMRLLPGKEQEAIVTEMADNTSKKETIREFIECFEVRTELVGEFVDTKLIEASVFDEIYNKCIADFIG